MASSIRAKNDLLRTANRLHLHLYHFARGVYPAATGIPGALPVNRCLMPLENKGREESYIKDSQQHLIMRPGYIYFIPAHHPAGVKLTENMRFISIQFLLDFHNGIDLFSQTKKIIELENPRLTVQADHTFDSESAHLLGVRLQSVVMELTAMLFERIEPDDLCLNMTADLSETTLNNLHERCTAKTTVAELAEQSNLCRDAFSRNFIRKNGISPKQFLNRCIMYRACSLLATGNLKIREIAEKLEFTNEFYFSRFFKKHSGMAPSQFRKEKFRL